VSEQLRFLVVEDDEPKRARLRAFLEAKYAGCLLVEAHSLMSGLRIVTTEPPFDLILLDMTIPNYDLSPQEPGGLTHGFGGKEFLIELRRFGMEMPVIVVTQFQRFGKPPNEVTRADLDRDLARLYSPPYVGMVPYEAAVHDWQDELRRMMNDALARKDERTP
jgi:CheY-like chemotaxis protein